eukprot:1142679-Pelagomonas_calceolata.AAC.13
MYAPRTSEKQALYTDAGQASSCSCLAAQTEHGDRKWSQAAGTRPRALAYTARKYKLSADTLQVRHMWGLNSLSVSATNVALILHRCQAPARGSRERVRGHICDASCHIIHKPLPSNLGLQEPAGTDSGTEAPVSRQDSRVVLGAPWTNRKQPWSPGTRGTRRHEVLRGSSSSKGSMACAWGPMEQ